jgi:hypothetical protein
MNHSHWGYPTALSASSIGIVNVPAGAAAAGGPTSDQGQSWT